MAKYRRIIRFCDNTKLVRFSIVLLNSNEVFNTHRRNKRTQLRHQCYAKIKTHLMRSFVFQIKRLPNFLHTEKMLPPVLRLLNYTTPRQPRPSFRSSVQHCDINDHNAAVDLLSAPKVERVQFVVKTFIHSTHKTP